MKQIQGICSCCCVHETGTATFIPFDRDVARLIPTTAYNMWGAVADCHEEFPEELDDMAGQRGLFDYKVIKAWNLDKNKSDYTVTKLSKDVSVINAFMKAFGIEVS